MNLEQNTEFEQAIANLEVKTQQLSTKHKYANWLVTLLLVVFPPIAIVLMWKDETYHGWFVWMSWIFGGFLILYFIFLNYILLPQINSAFMVVSAQKVAFSVWDWVGVLGLGIVQLGLGFVLKKKLRVMGKLSTAWLTVATALLVVDYIVPTMIYGKILGPIYSSLSGYSL